MYKWKILETEDVSPHEKWLPAYRDKVKLHNGEVMEDFYYASLGKIVILLPILKTGEIVFIRQYRHAIREVVIELPAGMVDGGRRVEEVAIAELHEEVGIKADKGDLVPLGKTAPSPHKLDMWVYGFALKDLEFNSEQELEPDEDIEVLTIEPKKASEMIKSGEIFQSDTISFLTIAKEKGLI